MSAEADPVPGAADGERSEHRTNHRNAYRHRAFDTRLERRQRAAAAGPPRPGRGRRHCGEDWAVDGQGR